MARQQVLVIAALLIATSLSPDVANQQCGIDTYSIFQKMLKGHTFMTFQARPLSHDCREACNSDVRCQSYNYLMFLNICELNNRTKEARPEDFIKNSERYYMKKARNRVPLGSIPELPAYSCGEIKASEGAQAVSGNYWLDSTRSAGDSILVRCDMKTQIADYCVKHQCQSNATCVSSLVNYTCVCNSGGWTGTYCEQAVDYCADHQCQNNATCVMNHVGYTCTCNSSKWIGDFCEQECQAPLGMESGAITDEQITASSEWSVNHAAVQGRLHYKANGNKKGAWSPNTRVDDNTWLQIDLASNHTAVTGVATQARNGHNPLQSVTKYNLQYSDDQVNFQNYSEQGQTANTEFAGNTDFDTVVYHDLNPPIRARYIRFRPVDSIRLISMRVELYGCQA